MLARGSWAVKAAVVVVAMLVAIGSWEAYRGGGALAQLNNGELPHFKCYNFVPAGPPVKAQVQLSDQFVSDPNVTVFVQTRHFLCAPVTKVHGARTFTADPGGKHLVCYHIRPSLGAVKADVVVLDDNFGEQTGEVTTPHLLCSPATKTSHVDHTG